MARPRRSMGSLSWQVARATRKPKRRLSSEDAGTSHSRTTSSLISVPSTAWTRWQTTTLWRQPATAGRGRVRTRLFLNIGADSVPAIRLVHRLSERASVDNKKGTSTYKTSSAKAA